MFVFVWLLIVPTKHVIKLYLGISGSVFRSASLGDLHESALERAVDSANHIQQTANQVSIFQLVILPELAPFYVEVLILNDAGTALTQTLSLLCL